MFGTKKKQVAKDVANQAGALAGNAMSVNAQAATDMACDSMEELLFKAGKLSKVGFEQSKGNLFEYIEAAKLQTNSAKAGVYYDKNPVTDIPESRGGFGGHTAPDDFRLMRDGKVISRGQAKYNNNPTRAAENFSNPKYQGMQRIAPSDQMDSIRLELDRMVSQGQISKATYQDAVQNLQYDGLTDPVTGISSGGTTTAELQDLRGADGKLSVKKVEQYAQKYRNKHFTEEVVTTSANMAAMSALSGAIVSGAHNIFDVMQNRKNLDEALKEIGVDTTKSAARGGATGIISSMLRHGGRQAQIPVLTDSTAATVLAGGIVDGGVAVYAYAKGEITADELTNDLLETTVKSVGTVYYMKAITAVVGAVNPFIPMIVYTVSSAIVSCARSIIEEANLRTAEYNRMTELLNESARLAQEYHVKLNSFMQQYETQQRQALQGLLASFEYNAQTGENYELAIYAIINFANQTGIALQHTDFNDFSEAMMSDQDFVLR